VSPSDGSQYLTFARRRVGHACLGGIGRCGLVGLAGTKAESLFRRRNLSPSLNVSSLDDSTSIAMTLLEPTLYNVVDALDHGRYGLNLHLGFINSPGSGCGAPVPIPVDSTVPGRTSWTLRGQAWTGDWELAGQYKPVRGL